ncbi:mpv17-like protein isoform X3 [Meriones unguiculatus]|uniref:mpv17-like protein isoform X3 n=1 Tax=Meriones unguiculatus TaxID=10047 RepID=UPI00293E2FDF|nr:mpv17-like protein isoform X3 [Meriones unguiculatus]
MARWWRAFPRAARRYPWPTNVLLYAGLFSAGDALQQQLRGGPADWRQTRRVATLAVTFHGNFNYVWLRLLERALPGRAPRTVLAKLLCDQTVGGPIALSAFYVAMSLPSKAVAAGEDQSVFGESSPGTGPDLGIGNGRSPATEPKVSGLKLCQLNYIPSLYF